MDGQLDLKTIVLLLIGGISVYIAWRHPALGAALLVGAGVVALLGMWLKP
jgi:hypothetical protein